MTRCFENQRDEERDKDVVTQQVPEAQHPRACEFRQAIFEYSDTLGDAVLQESFLVVGCGRWFRAWIRPTTLSSKIVTKTTVVSMSVVGDYYCIAHVDGNMSLQYESIKLSDRVLLGSIFFLGKPIEKRLASHKHIKVFASDMGLVLCLFFVRI